MEQLLKEKASDPAYNDRLMEEIKQDDKSTADKIDEIKKSIEKKEYNHARRIAIELFSILKPEQLTVYGGVSNLGLSVHLYGDEDTWREGINFYKSIETKYPYSHVLAAALYNNTKEWTTAKKTIEKVSLAEKALFSNMELNEYYKVFSLIQFNLNSIEESQKLILQVQNYDDESKRIVMTVFSDSLEETPLNFAKYFLTDKKLDLKLFAEATYYCINRFNLLQRKHSNSMKAYQEIKEYLDIAYENSKTIINELSSISSDPKITILSAIPAIARINGKSEEALEFIEKGIRNKIQDQGFLNNSAILLYTKYDYKKIIELLIDSKLEDMNESFFLLIHALKDSGNEDKIEELKIRVEKSTLSAEDKSRFLSDILYHTLSSDEFLIIAKQNYSLYISSAWAKTRLASALADTGDVDGTEKILLEIYEFSNKSLYSTASLARFYAEEKNDFKKAIQFFEKFISENSLPRELELYFKCLLNSNQYEKIIEKSDSLDKKCTNEVVQICRGISLGKAQDYESAVNVLKPILHNSTNSIKAHVFYLYASFSHEVQNFDEAYWALEKCVALDSNNNHYRLTYSQALIKQGKYEQALKEAVLVLKNPPNEMEEYINFLNAYKHLENTDSNNQYLKSNEMRSFFVETLRNFSKKYPDNGFVIPIRI